MKGIFCGHCQIYVNENEIKKITRLIRQAIAEGVSVFLCKTCGIFDNVCAFLLRKLKVEYPNIVIIAVMPYNGENYDEQSTFLKKLYDEVIYCPLENAANNQNEWIVDQADCVIAYAVYNFDEAAKTLEYAEQKEKKIIRLCK